MFPRNNKVKVHSQANDHEVEGRNIAIPAFIEAFETTAISSACSCLSLPTPIVTGTQTETSTITIYTTTTTTSSKADLINSIATSTYEILMKRI
jgi:hypothetical protein